MIEQISADGKMFKIGGENNSFKGCLGVALVFEKNKNLLKEYEEIMTSLFKKYGEKKYLNVYKSFDLYRIFYKNNKMIDILEELYIEFRKIKGIEINIFFTTFNTQIMPKVKYFGRGGSAVKKIDTLKFLDDLIEYYPYILVWKLCKSYQLRDCTIFLDNLQGKITEGWKELIHHNTIKILPRGDSVNVYISMADLIIRFIEEKIKSNHKKLIERDIKELLKPYDEKKVKVWYIGKKEDLDFIVPKYNHNIDLSDYLNIPTIHIIKEGIIDKEIDWIENSPHYNKIRNFASEIGGGIKFIEYSQDYHLLRKGDYILYFGDEGLKKFNYISKTLNYPGKGISISQL